MVSGANNNTLALSTLSQPFSPEPISVTVNCLLYASLSCSLLAAMGAMMCKEWLHSLDRAGQTGPIEDQGRLRQRKFDGAQQWQLEAIIDFLPNIVLFSVTLFFVGLWVYLLTVNTTVAAIVGAFTGFGAVVTWVSILASTASQFCPYETATARILKRIIRVIAAGWTRGRKMIHRSWKRILQLFGIRGPSSPGPQGGLPLPNGQQPADSTRFEEKGKELEKQHKQQVTNCQAALWLLETAPNRDDQLIAIQFLSTASRDACADVEISSDRQQLIVSLTLEAFDIWRSQPNERNQEMAEHFGRALCHVPLTARGERWKNLTELTQGSPPTFGRRFLRELVSFDRPAELFDTIGEEYTLQRTLLRTLILTKDIPIDSFRWTKLRILIRRKDDNSQLLGLWSILMYKGFGQSDKCRIRQSPAAKAALLKLRGSLATEVRENDFPLALACGVQALKSVERQGPAENATARLLDAVEIYNTCIHHTTKLSGKSRYSHLFRDLAAEAMMDMMKYFQQSTFLDPAERLVVDFFYSALQLLHSMCTAGYIPNPDESAFEGLWYTIDSVIVAIESSSYIDPGSAEELVRQTFESISAWLSANGDTDSPMVGLENHPRAIGWIAMRFNEELAQTKGRTVKLMYENRVRWFTQTSGALRTAWIDAGLGSHLMNGLKQLDASEGTGQLLIILEDITEMSAEWCHRLAADGFLDSVADAILHLDQLKSGTVLGWEYIQCRLLRALLSVWRHCLTDREIDWPTEKMLHVIDRASPVIERLLGPDTTQPEANVSPNVMLDRKAVSDIRDKLISFFNWFEEHAPASIRQDTQLAIGRLQRPIAVRAEEYRLLRASQTCSRDSYVDNGLL
ncbi:hypothetical protein FRC04_001502 [Tulasnella sp. 424]|nr:hypothetical protein FRC04_001502 [Tulasnella sp. 424]